MGIEAGTLALIGTALSAAGTGANMYNQRRVARDQEEQASRGIAQQQARQREIDARLNAEVGALEGSTPEDEQAASLDAYLSQLRANRASSEGVTTPGVSRYGEDTATSQAGVQNYGQKVASILSRIRGANEQRRNEGFGFNRAGTDVQTVSRNASGDDFINRLRMSQIRPNEWLDAAGQVAKGAGAGIVNYAGAMPGAGDPMDGLSPVKVTARPILRADNVWAGGSANPARRNG